MWVMYLNYTRRNHGQAVRSSTCCGRQAISTGRFSRRRRSSSPESAQAFSASEPTRRYAMQTVEAGFPTRTTPLRWSTRSNSRAIPGADSRLATDAARSHERTREHISRGSGSQDRTQLGEDAACTPAEARIQFSETGASNAESKDRVVIHYGCGAIGLRKSRKSSMIPVPATL